MKNGKYLFAYIEINDYANYYNIDTKRHDQNISLWDYNDGKLTLMRYWELERLSRIKHHNKAFFSENHALELITELLSEFHMTLSDLENIIAPPYFIPSSHKNQPIESCYNYHSLCHLFSSLLIETEKFYQDDILAFSVDLDADYISEVKNIKKNDYVGCISKKGNIDYFPIESPASLWSIASHDLKMGEGTLMSLASASTAKFIYDFDFSDTRFFRYDKNMTTSIYTSIKEIANGCTKNNKHKYIQGYDENYTFEENIISAIMKVIQKISFEIMQRNVDLAIEKYHINPHNTILAMSGGFALNCPTNSIILKHNKFKDFLAPPCINDSGQSLGMALYYFYNNTKQRLSFSLNNAFHGKRYSVEHIKNMFNEWIISIDNFDVDRAIKDIQDDVIVWFDGNSEIGPRALGHRSIISSPMTVETKTKINTIKKRQSWRPVAPLVLEREGDKWFEDFIPSRYMLLTLTIRQNIDDMVKAVSHHDKSSRLQTIDDKEERIYQILTKINETNGIPILCNTSLNDYNEPIIETPEEAMVFAIKKKISIIYLNGTRITINIDRDCDSLPEIKPQVDMRCKDSDMLLLPLNKDEYDFYYWSNLDTEIPLDSSKSINIIKRLYNAYLMSNSEDPWRNTKSFYY